MKNLIATLFIACLIITSTTAQSFVEQHYGDLLDREDVTVVNVSGKMFNMLSKFGDAADEQEAQDVLRMMESIESFTLVKTESMDNMAELFNKGKQAIGNYDELVRVRDKGTNVLISIDETNGVVHEIVGIISLPDEGGFVAASLLGRIDLDDVSRMVTKFQDKGLPMLREQSDLNIDAVSIYPNPVNGGARMTLEIDAALIGSQAAVMDGAGKVIRSYAITGQMTSIETSNLAAGQYYLQVSNGESSYKKQFIVIR